MDEKAGDEGVLKTRIRKIAGACRGWRQFWILEEDLAIEARLDDSPEPPYPNDRRRSFRAQCDAEEQLHRDCVRADLLALLAHRIEVSVELDNAEAVVRIRDNAMGGGAGKGSEFTFRLPMASG